MAAGVPGNASAVRSAAAVAIAAALSCGAPLAGCSSGEPAPEGERAAARSAGASLTPYVLRLRPGQDLKLEILKFARQKDMRAGIVLTCVGSLRRTVLRFADRPEGTVLEGKREIVSLVGTLTAGGGHLHLSVSDGEGVTVGGHLMDGCEVYTTAEIALGEAESIRFAREKDPTSGYDELVVHPR